MTIEREFFSACLISRFFVEAACSWEGELLWSRHLNASELGARTSMGFFHPNSREPVRVDAICADFNDCRMEAFAQSHFLKGGRTRSHLPNMLATLKTFFRFVTQIDSGGTFVHEDINRVRDNFKQIAHKFIFKFGDVDRETMNDVFDGLEVYYGFLASRKIVAAEDFKLFRNEIHPMKDELIGKMERYNAIRHDDSMDEDQKEEIREQLFEGDHTLPHF
jgi:hypothetical protein